MPPDATATLETPNGAESAPSSEAALSGEQPTPSETPDTESPSDESTADAESTPVASGDDAAEAAGTDADQPGKPSRSEREFSNRLKALFADPEKAREVLAPVIAPILETERATFERQRSEQATVDKARADAEQAAVEWQRRLVTYLGEPDQPNKPGTIRSLQQDIASLDLRIRTELEDPTSRVDLDPLVKEAKAKTASLAELQANNTMAQEIAGFHWDRVIGAGFHSPVATFPEFANNPAKAAAYINASDGIPGALKVLRDTVREAALAESAALIKTLKETHAAELKAMTADRDAMKMQAAGGESTASGEGTAVSGAGTLTPARYNAMTFEERQALTPAQKNEIWARARREQTSRSA